VAEARLAAIEARLRAGDARGALGLADALLGGSPLALADRWVALRMRSHARAAVADLAGAIADAEAAIALNPRDARSHNELGILQVDSRNPDAAIAAFRRATELDPRYARAWNNLGSALRDAGRLAEAEAAYARAAGADPRYVFAWVNLGAALRDLGRNDEAAAAFERALALDAKQVHALTGLAGLRRGEGRIDEASALYERALAADPRDADTWLHYGGTLAERDDLPGALRAYAEAEARDPKLLRALFGRCLTLPMVPGSATELATARAGYADGLAHVEVELPARAAGMAPDALVDELRWTNFLLAYQGEDDRELQQRFARATAHAVDAADPALRAPQQRRQRSGRRLRVGFASAFFRDGTVGRYFERWITDLPGADFEVFVYHLLPGMDEVASRLQARADRFHALPRFRPAQVAARVREDVLDVLVYPELGMDGTTFALAGLRLAPLQCAGWGHPVTTGHPTIDVFFTAAAMEPPDAQDHYAEKLVSLPGIGTRYARPAATARQPREALGLPSDGALLSCPQSLFKITPDDDALFARVLAGAPEARLVLFEGRHPALTRRYLARLDAALAAAGVSRGDRVVVLPQVRHDRYLELNLACEAMLDTLRWSGGNTTLDAIATGLPVVTLPGRFMRARQSAAMLGIAGVPDLVAQDRDDYVRIAVRLASDRAHRDALSARLADGAARVFDDAAPVDAFARWLLANG
jgi:CRISPR-associated protein Csy1